MKKIFYIFIVLAAVSTVALLAQDDKQDNGQKVGGRIIIGRRWLLVEFPCGNIKLKGWLFIPPGAENTPTPAVLRMPAGGNLFKPAVLGLGAIPEIEHFVTAGYVTLVMSFRETLDNPGNFQDVVNVFDLAFDIC